MFVPSECSDGSSVSTLVRSNPGAGLDSLGMFFLALAVIPLSALTAGIVYGWVKN